MLPVTATAQQKNRSGDRRSDRAADERRSDDRRSDGHRSDDRAEQRNSSANNQRQTIGLTPLGLPPQNITRTPWWEQRRSPWWEHQGQPSFAPKTGPAWDPGPLNNQRSNVRIDKSHRRRGNQPAVVYVLPPYRYFPTDSIYSYGVSSSTTFMTEPAPNVVSMPPPPEAPPITTGFLKLEVEPRALLQVFIDGYYIGTLSDLGDEIELRLGARRIELRAPGYRTLVFDTEIVPDRTIVYRGELEPVGAAPGTPPPAAIIKPSVTPGPRTIYVIPGCYVGNVAPVQANLRAGCDVSKVSKIEP
jgi:hypothetical protein